MNKKILSLLVAFVSASSCFIGCGNPPKDTVLINSSSGVLENSFIPLGDRYVIGQDEYCVCYHRYTKIVYLYNDTSCIDSARRALSPFIGEDKLPMKLDEYEQMKNNL